MSTLSTLISAGGGGEVSSADVKVGEITYFLDANDPTRQGSTYTDADGKVFMKTGTTTDDVATYPDTAISSAAYSPASRWNAYNKADNWESTGEGNNFQASNGHWFSTGGTGRGGRSTSVQWINLNNGTRGQTPSISQPTGVYNQSYFQNGSCPSANGNRIWMLIWDSSRTSPTRWRWISHQMAVSGNSLTFSNPLGANANGRLDTGDMENNGLANNGNQTHMFCDNHNKLWLTRLSGSHIPGVSNALNDSTREYEVHRFSVSSSGDASLPIWEAKFNFRAPHLSGITYNKDTDELILVNSAAMIARPMSMTNWDGADTVFGYNHGIDPQSGTTMGVGMHATKYAGQDASGNPMFTNKNATYDGTYKFTAKPLAGYGSAMTFGTGSADTPYWMRIK